MMSLFMVEPIWLVSGMFLGGAIGALIGTQRRRAVLGFLLGCLFGPLGWALILLAADHGPKCPECGGAVNKGARRCCHCGVELGAAAAASRKMPGRKIQVKARRNPAPAAPDTVACPHCGAACSLPEAPGTYACPHCGKAVEFA